jgi:Periplasmic binding protein.
LARAEYIKFFGLLTGRKELSDSLFADIRDRYLSLVCETDTPKKVLVNIPYADQWYIPGGDNYMTRLISDAGGEVLGAVPGRFESSVISVEKAFEYAQKADFWLNPGWCSNKDQLRSVHPLFADFPRHRQTRLEQHEAEHPRRRQRLLGNRPRPSGPDLGGSSCHFRRQGGPGLLLLSGQLIN